MRLALALLLLASGAWADESVSPTAKPAPESVTAIAQAWGHSGFLYSFSVSTWSVFNGNPLAYTPVEFGYDFGSGLRVQSGMDLLYYEGNDTDEKHPEAGTRRYSYEMSNWRTSLLYRMPVDTRVRPLLGVSLNAFGGSRRLTPDFQGGKDINADASKFAAWSYIGIGAQLGLEYLLTYDWSLLLSGRYDFTFTAVPSPVVTQLGLAVTF